MKRTLHALGLGIAAVLVLSLGALASTTYDYDETTTVAGKIPVDLRGAWLLVAQPEVAQDKFKSFVELLTITQGKDGRLSCHLLDVRLPPAMATEVKKVNDDLVRWVPSADELAKLRKGWSRLPPATEKSALAGDLAYGRIRYRLAAPERYAEVFTKQNAALKGLLSESTFTLEIVEQYRPLPLAADSRIIQLLQRTSIYGFRGGSGPLLEGAALTGFLAAHPLAPLPLDWSGRFTMYRLASAKEVGGAVSRPSAKPTARKR